MNNAYALESIVNKPLMVTPEFARVLVAQVQGKLEIISTSDLRGEFNASFATPKEEIEPNIHVVDVFGSLAHRGSWFDVGYDDLKMEISQALSDPEIDGIFMNIDSPGGAVAGCFDFCKWLKAVGDVKPIWGIANESAYSAAYAMASSMDRFIMPEGAGAGSIGVVMAHVSYEKMMDEQGVKVTFIHKGEHKVAGNPYQDLTADQIKQFEAALDKPYERFVNHVSDMRGIDVEAVKDTEAGTFGAASAVNSGFADEVLSADDAYMSFVDYLKGGSNRTVVGGSMTTQNKVAEVDMEAVKAEAFAAGKKEGELAGQEIGATNERTRILAILSDSETVGREATAYKLIDKGHSAEGARDILATIPRQEKEDNSDALNAELKGNTPDVSGGLDDGVDDSIDTKANHILDFTALVNSKEHKAH